MVKRRFELTGKTFGNLIVTAYAGLEGRGHAMWKCKCSCGKDTVTRGSNLTQGTTKSCGCLVNAAKKGPKCQRGHVFDAENTIVGKGGRRTCRTCKAQGDAKHYLDNRDDLRAYRREWNLASKGWSQESFDNALKEQEGKCYICSKELVVGIMGANMACADHIHSDPPRPRALLCNNCNAGIGVMQDNPALLRLAADYIEKFK